MYHLLEEIRKDFLIFSGLAGIFATIIRSLFTLIFYLLQVTGETSFFIFTDFLFQPNKIPPDSQHFFYHLLGYLSFLVFGAIFALGLSYIYKKFSTRFYLIKSIAYGITIWIVVRNVILNLIGPVNPSTLGSQYVAFFSHILFSVIAGYLIVKYGKFLSRHNQPH